MKIGESPMPVLPFCCKQNERTLIFITKRSKKCIFDGYCGNKVDISEIEWLLISLLNFCPKSHVPFLGATNYCFWVQVLPCL